MIDMLFAFSVSRTEQKYFFKRSYFKPGMWKRKHFEERNWKQKRTKKHLTFWGAGSGSIFHKTWCFRFL